jgi:hypothetical protein
MPTFGYFHAHYLFSSALILAMSSFVPIGNPNDMSGFDSALDLLRSMAENGNLAAAEFCHNLEQVKACLNTYRVNNTGGIRRNEGGAEGNSNASTQMSTSADGIAAPAPASAPGPSPNLVPVSSTLATSSTAFPSALSTAPTAPMMPSENDILAAQSSHGTDIYALPSRDTINGYTTEMAFLEPTMQDFLAQSDIDLGLLHPVDTFLNEAENLYTCHEL